MFWSKSKPSSSKSRERFVPKDDITAYELAVILMHTKFPAGTHVDETEFPPDMMESLMRHFTIEDGNLTTERN